jgi:hypothetical protein
MNEPVVIPIDIKLRRKLESLLNSVPPEVLLKAARDLEKRSDTPADRKAGS